MSTKNKVTRRGFLKTSGLTVATAGIASLSAKSLAQVSGANDRLNTAIIGCGGMAKAHLESILEMRRSENLGILAVCDVYQTRAKQFQDLVKANGGEAKIINDYRDVLAIKDVDYVTIATPEHWHGQQILDALDAGKHIYCEKPLTRTIEEAQAVLAKVKKTDLKLQVGVQGMSDDSYASAFEAIKTGKLGPVIHAQIDYCRCYTGKRGPFRVGTDPKDPKPPDLDWEAWLGSAPKRPWSAPRYFEWRAYSDYSGGIASDLFVHRITRLIKACGLRYPSRVAGMGGIYLWPDGRDLPDNIEMIAEYPAQKPITPGMTVHILGSMTTQHGIDHCIRGQKGTLLFNEEGWEIIKNNPGKGENPVIETHKKTGGENINLHHKNHHAAIRHGTPLNCPPELGLYGLIPVAMANHSWAEGKMLRWDADKGAVVPAEFAIGQVNRHR